MIEMTIYGRGGQGGVTLAKLIATVFFLRGKDVQAFGVYAAERSGAPLQAFVRIDDNPITNHNQVRMPDHVIILDRTLISSGVVAGMNDSGWLILNTPKPPTAYADEFKGRSVASVDATGIAVDHGLGTRAVPIVNTAMLGAVARVLGLTFEDVELALTHLKFCEADAGAARRAYQSVVAEHLEGQCSVASREHDSGEVAGILDEDVGGMPLLRTGNWATQRPGRRALTPPCHQACPAGNDIQGFIAAMAGGQHDEALRILLETSPLPGVCGRVCPAPCMESCNRGWFDDSVNIRELERAAADNGARPPPRKPWRAVEVAVVGSGPAGISAAYHLARLGYRVRLYEADEDLGGILRTGIPTYRLPREVLDAEIAYVLDHGVKVLAGEFVDRAALMKLSYLNAAVIVATGLQRMRGLRLGSAPNGIVVDGLEFLDRARQARESLHGLDVLVVGGGNTAIDAARTARRAGAKNVRIVYRRTRKEMPAIREEIEGALEEGIRIDELVSPLRLHKDAAGPVLTCQRMRLEAPDASGRPRPVPEICEDSRFDIRCHRVILALGQSSDQSILPEGADVREGEHLIGLTGAPIFFCGDFASNEGTVSAAMGSGRAAAWHVHRTATGEDLFPASEPRTAGHDDLTTHVFKHAWRREGVVVAPERRKRSFTEVRTGFKLEPLHSSGENDAVAEARRCFSCGVCNYCDRCLDYCPEGIVLRDGDGYRFDYDYCKGCGICAQQCPRGVIYMSEL